MSDKAQELAASVYQLLGCYGFARVDMIMSTERRASGSGGAGDSGLTETSLLPQAAEAAGMRFEQLIGRLVELALARPKRPALAETT